MKRLLIILIALTFLTGCGNVNNTPSPTPEPTATPASTEAPTPEPTEAPTPEPTAEPEEKIVASVSTSSGMIMVNDQIPQDLRDELHTEDQRFIQNMLTMDTDAVAAMLRPSLISSPADLQQVIDLYAGYLMDKEITYLEEILFSGKAQGIGANVMSPSPHYPFLVHAPAEDGDIAISLMSIPFNFSVSLLSIVRVRKETTWEITSFYISDISYYGMNTVDLFEKAKALQAEGHLTSAVIYMIQSTGLLRPSPNLQYNQDADIQSYVQTLLTEFYNTYAFPQPIPGHENLVIYGLDAEPVTDGFMPVIMYISELDVTDESESNQQALKDEANTIHETVMGLYEGLDEDFDVFLYKIFSESPDSSSEPVPGFAVVVENE